MSLARARDRAGTARAPSAATFGARWHPGARSGTHFPVLSCFGQQDVKSVPKNAPTSKTAGTMVRMVAPNITVTITVETDFEFFATGC